MRKGDLGRILLLAVTAAALVGVAAIAFASSSAGYAESAPAQATGGAEISAPLVTVAQWSTSGGDRAQPVTGTVTLDGAPVSGARLSVGGFRLPEATDEQGRFVFPVDRNVPQRYPVKVVDANAATVGGTALSGQQRAAVLAAEGGIDVLFQIREVTSAIRADGSVAITGTLSFGNGDPPPPVGLYAFRLAGIVKDAAGNPAQGVLVATKAEDRWTLSNVTGADGRYSSVFWPTPEDKAFRVTVYEGNRSFPVEGDGKVTFAPLKSAQLDLTLDRAAGVTRRAEPQTIEAAVYDGLLVGVLQQGKPVRPLAATWPDRQGRFTMILPASMAGQQVAWWEQQTFYYANGEATPGGPIDVTEWPQTLGVRVAQGLGPVTLASK